jgi:hypothetical protein
MQYIEEFVREIRHIHISVKSDKTESLHDDLNAFLNAEVTGWGIPKTQRFPWLLYLQPSSHRHS